jgi:hypothetical protein
VAHKPSAPAKPPSGRFRLQLPEYPLQGLNREGERVAVVVNSVAEAPDKDVGFVIG